MAPLDALAGRVPPSLHDDLVTWYREWDESTSTDRWSTEEWFAEGERLVATLQGELGPEWDVYLDS